MSIIKVQSEGINLADTFAFTGTFSPNNTPCFLAYRASSTQAMTQNATTTVIMNAESFDTDSAYNTSTGTFTCPTGKAGKYVFSLGYSLSAGSNQTHCGFQIMLSGANKNNPYSKSDPFINFQNQIAAATQTIVVDLEAGMTIHPIFYTGSAGIEMGTGRSFYCGYKLNDG